MSLKEHEAVLTARINRLIDALIQNYYKQYSVKSNELSKPSIGFDIVEGTKYYKLILQNSGTSVHAFIHKQSGAVFKPASWKAPAKHVRYNLLDDASFETCLQRADWVGSYLYM